MKHILLPGLTTTPQSDWKRKIEEIDELGIEEIALFPTWFDLEQRKELHTSLASAKRLKRIPHVHLRDDSEVWELDYYTERYGTEVFNIHLNRHNQETAWRLVTNTRYRKRIFIETTDDLDDVFLAGLRECGGLCIDVSHLEDPGFSHGFKGYERIDELLREYPIGCAHISAVTDRGYTYVHYITKEKYTHYSAHSFRSLSEFDYVRKYLAYFPRYVSIELESTFTQQLQVKAYLDTLLNS